MMVSRYDLNELITKLNEYQSKYQTDYVDKEDLDRILKNIYSQ